MQYYDERLFETLPVDTSRLPGYEAGDPSGEILNRLERKLFDPIDKAGSARTQEEYEAAYDRVFETLQTLDERFAKSKYLLGENITEADLKLFSVLARFDSIFYFAYRLNRHKLKDYPWLFRYVRQLYQTDAIHSVTDLKKIKEDYYETQTDVQNPYHLVMLGPDMSDWEQAIE